jgi:class 3 adenylate cyclase/Tfp pilus assembly protein PilF
LASLLTIVFIDVVESSATKRDVSLGRDSRERDHAYLEKVQSPYFNLIRDCYRAHGGREVNTMGDAFYLVFEDPLQATRCAMEIQRKLVAGPIETPRGPLQLRIGIHSGYPEMFEGTYHGTDVDTAARVEAMGTAQQILLSSATYELVRNMTDVTFHRMGEFTLKGIGREVLWEADWNGRGPRPTAVPPLTVQRRKKRAWLGGGAVAVLTVASTVAYFYVHQRHSRELTDKDTVVLADFANNTGDRVFDDTLKTALSVALNQSPFLDILPESKVAATLKLMARPANTTLTPDVAGEVCQRAGSKAYLAGSISNLGSQYVLGLKAVNCQSGDLLAEEQATAAAKEKVLDALGGMAAKLRGELGESLATVHKFDVPLEQATTSSLEALKTYSLGVKAANEKGPAAALPYFQHAIELDPNFAMGYRAIGNEYWNLVELGRGSEYLTKAFQLREHASERERLFITASYYLDVTGELDRAAQANQEFLASYPQEGNTYNSLGNILIEQGQYGKAVDAYRQSIRLRPDLSGPYLNLGNTHLALQRFEEARQAIREAQARQLDDFLLHIQLYALAFLKTDAVGMAEQQKWFAGRPEENYGLSLASDSEAYGGHLGRARELTRQSVESAIRTDNKESGATWQENAALREAAFGNAAEAQRSAAEGLKLAPASQGAAVEAALAYALAGDAVRAESLAQDLNKRFPLDTQMQSLWLPAIRARLALNRQNPAEALRDLEAAAGPIEFGTIQFLTNVSCLYPTYIRGEAYLEAGQGSAAAAEFQKILDHGGMVWNCWTGALAHLGVARAYALEAGVGAGLVPVPPGREHPQGAPLQQDADAARVRALAAYKDFLALWKDADPNIPILKQARAEYAKLQ